MMGLFPSLLVRKGLNLKSNSIRDGGTLSTFRPPGFSTVCSQRLKKKPDPTQIELSWYFIGILSMIFLNFGLILVFFGRIKIGLVFGFSGCHFIGFGL